VGERVLTKEQAMNLEGIEVLAANPSTSGALSVLQVARELARACRSHEALREQSDRLRAALTQSAGRAEKATDAWRIAEKSRADAVERAEKAERERDEQAEACLRHEDEEDIERMWRKDLQAKVARLERTVERLSEALNAARRILTHGSYNHAYCNLHDGERGAERKCPGCRAAASDRAMALAASSPDHAGVPSVEAGEGETT